MSQITQLLKQHRRNLHTYPETAWTEFQTTWYIYQQLMTLPFKLRLGKEILNEAFVLNRDEEEVKSSTKRALNNGVPKEFIHILDEFTGVMATFETHKSGPTFVLRFDIDALSITEDDSADHNSGKNGFISCNPGAMHACGHDGHTAMGLTVAKILAQIKEQLHGTIKLIFQPAEEGVRGARAMVAKGIVDDVDYMFGGHIGFKATKSDSLVCLTGGFLATTKLDASFKGESSHAGAAPERGRNALLAAAASCIALHSISRHGQGASRINVGVLQAGTGRNVLPDVGLIKMETRGANTEINEFMVTEARRMIKASADMYNVDVTVSEAGGAPACVADHELGAEIKALAEACGQYGQVVDYMDLGGSEDCSYFMERVQQNGGRAAYLMYGTEIAAGHHNSCFDFDEKCLYKAVAMLTELAIAYTNK